MPFGDLLETLFQNESVVLIPELVNMTGLTDVQRANFRLMEGISTHTRQEMVVTGVNSVTSVNRTALLTFTTLRVA
jgi:hypothetical protein